MKGQFATIEALVSLVFVLALVAFMVEQLNAYNQSAYAAREKMQSGIATYDLVDQLLNSGQGRACMQAFASGSYSCMAGYLVEYKSVYKLQSIGIVSGEHVLGNLSGASDRCFPYNYSGNVTVACVGVG